MTGIVLTYLGLVGIALAVFSEFAKAVRDADRHRGVFEDGEPW